MAGSIYHLYTSPVPDGTATSVVRPSNWNSNHLYSGIPDGVVPIGNTAGATAYISSGTLYLAGGNNLTISQNGNSLTLSGASIPTVPQNSIGASNIGNTLGNTGVYSGQVVFAGGNNITLSISSGAGGAQTITISGPNAGGAQTGISSIADSANTQSVGVLSLSNANGVTFGLSTGALTATLTASVQTNYQTPGAYLTTAMQSNAATISNINFSAGTASANLSALTFSNSGGVSFGLNAGTVTATVATNYQSQGAYLTTAALSQNTSNYAGINGAITGGSLTVNTSGVSINLPAYLTTAMQSNAATISNINVSAGASSALVSAITFSNANGVTFGYDKTNVTASVAAQSNQTLSLAATSNTAGNTSGMSVDARSVTFAGYGAASVGYSTSAGGSSIVVSVPNVVAQTNQSGGVYASSNTFGTSSGTYDARSISIAGSGAVGVAASNSGWVVSAPILSVGASNIGNTAGNTGIYSGQIVFAGGNNVTLSVSSAAGGAQTITISGANAGGAQTGISGIVVSNTTYTSGTVSFSNANGISFGSSAGQAVTASYALNVSAGGGTSNALSAITFTNSNGVTFGLSTGAGVGTMTASVAAQTVQTVGLYGVGNTTQNSSTTLDARTLSLRGNQDITVGYSNGSVQLSVNVTGAQSNQTVGLYAVGNSTQNSSTTLDARTLSFNAVGAMSMGYSNGSIQASVPATSSLVGTNGISVSSAGSTISIFEQPISVFEPFPIQSGTAYSSHAPASWWFNRVLIDNPLAVSNVNVVKSLSPAVPILGLASSGTQVYSYTHGITVYSRQNYGAQSSNLTTVTTASLGITASLSITVSSVSAGLTYVTNTTGGTSSFSTAVNGASYSSWSNYFSGPFVFAIPMLTTIQQGEYFFAHAHSSTAATGGNALFAASTVMMSFSNLHVAPQVVGPLQLPGQSVTQASLNPWGLGGGIASAVTTNASMPGSVISGQTQNNIYLALSNV